jgi:effector-binding domain-containing protein/soluble cytochrome b562
MKPDEINPENGYRFYSISQLKKMLLINRFKSYHFSLEEIRTILDFEADQSEEKLHSVLSDKRKEIQDRRDAFDYTLEQMDRDLLNLERGVTILSYLDDIKVELVETQPLNILSLRRMMSREDYAEGYGRYFGMLYERIASEKLTMLGTPMTIYFSPEYDPSGNDTEFAIPVLEKAKGTRELQGGLCARSVLKGPYSELTSVYARLREWVELENYEMVNPPFEIYVTQPGEASALGYMVTEVYFPVKKKRY